MERQLQSESWDVVCFGGEESLCLAKFAKQVTNNLATLSPYFVHVEGRYLKDDSSASILGKLKEGKNINGYIRNIRIEDLYSKKKRGLSVGCSNATLEDIAAERVSFFFFGEPGGRHNIILDRHYMYYSICPNVEISDNEMMRYHALGQYLKAIAIAKKLGNDVAQDLLMKYLEQKKPASADMKEMAAEAFRSLEELCKKDSESSQKATGALIDYINKNVNIPAYRNSVIYAIEALGFVANYHELQKAKVRRYLSDLLGSCQRKNFKNNTAIYWHIVWASLVTLLRTLPTNPETAPLPTTPLPTAPFFTIKTSLLNDEILAEIKPKNTRSVIQKALGDVIIYSGIMTRDAYILTYGLNETDINDMQTAAAQDSVTKTKKLGNNSMNWITRAAPRLANAAENLTIAMATTILIGVVKSYFHLP
jgi:hypothetical protein